jgi:hypothetical protein
LKGTPVSPMRVIVSAALTDWCTRGCDLSRLSQSEGRDFRAEATATQSGRLSAEKIDRWLPAQDSVHDCSVEIGVRQKSNLHERRVVRIASRVRMSLSRRLAGSGSEVRFPSAHFWF